MRLFPLLAVLALTGCATSYRQKPSDNLGVSAFSFTLSEGQCQVLKKERRTYRAVEATSTYVAGAGAILTGIALAFTDEKVAPAISAGLTLGASGVGVFSGSQENDLDEELTAAGCPR